MQFVIKKHLARRTFLRGVGITLGLPLLDSMVPAQTPLRSTAANPRPRMGFVYVPHGAIMDKWTPATTGKEFSFTPILEPLESYRKHLLIVSGLASHNADGGVHVLTTPTWLSGVHPKRTDGSDVAAGTTIDQIAAQKISQDTPFPSLELTTEDVTSVIGGCEAGYSCVYYNTCSWRTPTMPLPMEVNPRVVFERLLGEGGTQAERLAARREDNSVLDAITQQVHHLKARLGSRDQVKLDDYLDSVREIERRIQAAEKQQANPQISVPDAPVGVPEQYDEHVKLMFDLVTIAYQADLTRVFTFMFARELSQRVYLQVGVSDPHHSLSHHQNDKAKIARLVKINNYHAQLFSYFMEKLRSTPDGDGTLLDHALLLYGSNMSNSNLHSHYPLPSLLAGGACGRLEGGRHLQYPETPMSNLLMSLLDKVDVEVEHLGDGTGKLLDV
jgi:hypothetical protein